ncbi:hypothetical protein HDV05_001550 [Chytridiales sp. JEL 0842]|nr:hypothetical protein HDV05_001550 [Chytridiales sp. JEL 0842]
MQTTSTPSFNEDDVKELRQLLPNARQPAVRQLLMSAIESAVKQLPTSTAPAAEQPNLAPAPSLSSNQQDSKLNLSPRPTAVRVLSTYSWTEDSKKATIYVTLPTPASSSSTQPDWEETPGLVCNNKTKEMEMQIADWANKVTYRLRVVDLAGKVDVTRSSAKLKNGKVTIHLYKEKSGEWGALIKKKEKLPDFAKNEDADPGDTIMQMMKELYNEGDEETKRMIAKTWTESQERKGGKLGDPLLDPMMGMNF